MIKEGDRILIKDNLLDEMRRIEFVTKIIPHFQNLIGTKQTAYAIWEDEDTSQKFITIDLCVEIPIQCCEKI